MTKALHLLFLLGLWSNLSSAAIALKSDAILLSVTTLNLDINDSLVLKKIALKKSKEAVLASYHIEKESIETLRKQIVEDLNRNMITMDSVKSSFTNHLVYRLIPHWYGTKWSFGGHTAIPNQGEIACGYFVSTTLRDMGLNLNRYKLAQKSPIDEAKMISCGSEIKTITARDTETAIKEICEVTPEGISFIGFDEGHVGFLLKQYEALFLIHSNYLFPNAVCMERIEDSSVFKKFSKFYIVEISTNERLLQHWLNGIEIL
jgi:hypothetical protein